VRDSRTTTQGSRAKLALIVLGVASCVGAAAYAQVRQTGAPHDRSASARSPKSLSIRVNPLTRAVAPGEVAEFTIQIRRRGRRRVGLSLLDQVPGANASLIPASTTGSTVLLRINTAGAPSGGHRITLLARSGRRSATAAVNLVISSPRSDSPPQGSNTPEPSNFTISGDLNTPLEPGSSAPLDLALANPDPGEIAITDLAVTLTGLSAPHADATHPCGTGDFLVTQFSGAYGFRVPASSTRRLGELGIPSAQWPQVAMLDRPLNQNGCKGASLRFSYSGRSQGGSP
jgi:hypothetical protein